MKTTKILTVLLIFTAIAFTSKITAQNKTSKYYFAWAYTYQTDTPRMYISNVKHSKCPGIYGYGISETTVSLQWMDYLKATYTNYYQLTDEEYVSKSESEAQIYRRKIMGNFNGKIIKVDDFIVYCDD